MSAPEALVRAASRVLFTALPDGGVLLDLQTKVYFTLNASGSALWNRLASGPQSRRALVEHLSEEFEVDAPEAERDVDVWIGDLSREGLVHLDR